MTGRRHHVLIRICSRCNQKCELAVACFACGRLDYYACPDTLLCYSCQLSGKDGISLDALKRKYRVLWRAATQKPYPVALQ